MTLSLPALQAALAQETGQVFLICLTITHPSLALPIRLVQDKADLVRATGTFTAFSFEIALPAQRDDQPPEVVLAIDNVDLTIISAITGLTTPPEVTMEVVLASSPDVVEAGPFVMSLRRAPYDEAVVNAELGFEGMLDEPFPKDSFTPKDFPGLFT